MANLDMAKPRLLPGGNVTYDPIEYTKTWRKLCSEVISFFPSYYVGGYDPGILLHSSKSNASFKLPLTAAFDLAKLYEKLNQTISEDNAGLPTWTLDQVGIFAAELEKVLVDLEAKARVLAPTLSDDGRAELQTLIDTVKEMLSDVYKSI